MYTTTQIFHVWYTVYTVMFILPLDVIYVAEFDSYFENIPIQYIKFCISLKSKTTLVGVNDVEIITCFLFNNSSQ
jgi:hypothetical protein